MNYIAQSSGRSADQGTINSVEIPQYKDDRSSPTHMDSLQSAKCEVCLEQFPNLTVDTDQCCRQCAADNHALKLCSSQNNKKPGVVYTTRTYI